MVITDECIDVSQLLPPKVYAHQLKSYLIDHVAELQFVNRLIYAIKRIYTHTEHFGRSS